MTNLLLTLTKLCSLCMMNSELKYLHTRYIVFYSERSGLERSAIVRHKKEASHCDLRGEVLPVNGMHPKFAVSTSVLRMKERVIGDLGGRQSV